MNRILDCNGFLLVNKYNPLVSCSLTINNSWLMNTSNGFIARNGSHFDFTAGLQRAMLRPVRSDPPAPAPRAAPRATLQEAARDGTDVAKNAFLLAHGYVTWRWVMLGVRKVVMTNVGRWFVVMVDG